MIKSKIANLIIIMITLLFICEICQAAEVKLKLTYPAGASPKVFTSGWIFGASATIGTKDISDQVMWSGSGKFNPAKGKISRPVFGKPGNNYIILKVKANGKEISKKFAIVAISPDKYASTGDTVRAICSHGCPMCPHNVTGHIETGSSLVTVRGNPAARKGDTGHHASCCGSNTFIISEGDSSVLINGKPAARKGDRTLHCDSTIGKIGGAGADNQADGKYTGTANPPLCTGTVTINISGGSVTGSYSGISPMDKSVSISTKWTGTYDADSNTIKGSVAGSRKTSTKTESLSGTFSTSVTGNSISGKWNMIFRGQSMPISINLTKQ